MFHQKPLLGQQINWAHPLAKGLVGCWVFNEGSGGKTYDLSGNHNTGVITGPTWDAGNIVFSGHNDIIEMLDSSVYDFGGPFSVVTNVLVSVDSSSDICTRWDGVDLNFVLMYVGGTQELKFYVGGGAGDNAASSSAINLNQFYNIVGVYDGTNTKIYIDGQWEDDAAIPLAPVQVSTSIRLGLRHDNSADLDGKIKYNYFYNRALTPQEIMQLKINPCAMFGDLLPIELMAYVAAAAGATANPMLLMNHFGGGSLHG